MGGTPEIDPGKITLPGQVRFERPLARNTSDIIPIGYDMDPAILRIRDREFWKQITLIKLDSVRQIIGVHGATIAKITEEIKNLPSEQFRIPG